MFAKPVFKNRRDTNMREVYTKPAGSGIGGEPPGAIPISRGGKPVRALTKPAGSGMPRYIPV